jgi:hypothetical protein
MGALPVLKISALVVVVYGPRFGRLLRTYTRTCALFRRELQHAPYHWLAGAMKEPVPRFEIPTRPYRQPHSSSHSRPLCNIWPSAPYLHQISAQRSRFRSLSLSSCSKRIVDIEN